MKRSKEKNDIDEKLFEIKDMMLSHFDKIYGKLEKLDQEYFFIKEGLKRLENEVAVLKTDVAEIKADLAEVKADLAEVKADLAEVKADLAGVKTELAEVKEKVNNIDYKLSEHIKMPAHV